MGDQQRWDSGGAGGVRSNGVLELVTADPDGVLGESTAIDDEGRILWGRTTISFPGLACASTGGWTHGDQQGVVSFHPGAMNSARTIIGNRCLDGSVHQAMISDAAGTRTLGGVGSIAFDMNEGGTAVGYPTDRSGHSASVRENDPRIAEDGISVVGGTTCIRLACV